MQQLPFAFWYGFAQSQIKEAAGRAIVVIDSNDFIQNEATLCQHTTTQWTNDPSAGPELRVGESSYTETNSFYDGGFTSAGVFVYLVPYCLWVDGNGRVEPDAHWTWTLESCTFVDHG